LEETANLHSMHVPLKGQSRSRYGPRSDAGIEKVATSSGCEGGDNDDLYLARYAPDGESKFLGVAPLDFHPVPGAWYKLRAVALSNRLMIFVNENQSPLIDIVDSDPLWSDGSVSLGGGWLPVEFRDVQVRSLTQGERPCFRKNECTKAEQHGERTASRSPAR
jgi:hypothetical protein